MVSQVDRTNLAERSLSSDTIARGLAIRSAAGGVTGTGASAGIASGRAKVVRSPGEISKVQPGDVLVCAMMTPALTSLLPPVNAIVADRGGVLSNGAVIAREYGLPFVVQTVVGTSVIRDGMVLIVDGGRGIVCVDTSPSE